jgi:ribosomal protein S18 acetylase RimI-like enzyme
LVDAKNERAASFYKRYGFQPFPDAPLRLYLPLETIERLGL